MGRLSAFALVLFLSTGLWGDVVRAAAAALGFETASAVEEPTPPPTPTTDSGTEWDPWGVPRP